MGGNEQKIYLANRGNLGGVDVDEENSMDYLQNAISEGFCVKTDVWLISGRTVTGVTHPSKGVDLSRLGPRDKFLIQARNSAAYWYLLKEGYHCFWRESDSFVMTNKNYVLSYGGYVFPKAIVMEPEEPANLKDEDYIGLCSNFIAGYRT
jgi:hypothetical protein